MVKSKTELACTTDAGPDARHAVRAGVGDHLAEEELEIVEMLVTELAANAVSHAGLGPQETLVLHLAVAPERVRVELCDDGPSFEPRDVQGPRGAAGGFGLVMVDRAASRWGVAADDGNCVWFELDRPPR